MKLRKLRITRKQISLAVALLVAGAVFTFGSIASDKVFAALSSVSPNPSDVDAGGIDGGMSHLIKKETVANVTTLRLAAYYPQSSGGDGSNKTLSLRYGINDKKCLIVDSIANQGGNVHVKITGTSTKHYKIPIDRVCENLRNAANEIRTNVEDNGGNAWKNNKFFADYPFPNSMVWDERVKRYKVDITIYYGDDVKEGASDTNSVNFITDVSGSGEIGPLANESANELGYRSAYFQDAPARSAHVSVQFTVPCDATKDFFDVRLYDPDEGVFGRTYIWANFGGGPLPYGRYEPSSNVRVDGWSSSEQAWQAGAGSDNFSKVRVRGVERGDTYRFHIRNDVTAGKVSPNYNVLSLGIPYDSIPPSGVNCNYELEPTITLNSSGTYVYYPDAYARGGISKSGAGPVPDSHPWEVYVAKFTSAPNKDLARDVVGMNACDNVQSNGRTVCTRLANTSYSAENRKDVDYSSGGPDTAGTHVCFFTRVKNPTEKFSDDDVWRYSDMVCTISTKKPRAQFRGSDLRVTGNISSGSYLVQGTNFGSWAEYGMFLSGVNSMAASGGALKNGSTASVDAWNQLTFANRDSVGNPSYGYFGLLPGASSAYGYFTGLPRSADSLNAATIPNGVYNVGGSVGNTLARLPEAKGGGVVLIRDGNFTISDNIIVDNAGRTSAREITQVVIVANNIMIDEDVTRVDAWLVTPSTGSITTCPVAFSNLNAGECNQKLTVNGAIHTGKLYLRRTAGANPPGADQLKEPAEVFNLRPDAQLWAYTYANKADYAQTDYIQELPPRY